jgi:predicted  nucleic acid-binding Zn-ribbon protein
MPIQRVVSNLGDQEYIRALEREIQQMKDQMAIMKSDIEELQRRL